MRCPQCAQEDWISGEIGGQQGLWRYQRRLLFMPKATKTFVLSYPSIRAQACRMCGYLSLSVDPEKLKATLKS